MAETKRTDGGLPFPDGAGTGVGSAGGGGVNVTVGRGDA